MPRQMKDSGVEWIGEIPQSWATSKVKYFVDCYDGRRVPVDAALRKSGPYPYWGAGSITDYVDNYLFDEELVLLGEDGAPFFDSTRPVAFLVNEKIWVNNHIHVLKPKKFVSSKYLVYFLNIVDYKTYINGSILNKLTQSNMNTISFVVPSIAEQHCIASHLDTQCARIDAVIEKTRSSIEEYKKLKQALITQAVTKGIRGDRPMKDSGVEWFGKIPKDVKLSRVGLHYDIILGKMICSNPTNDEMEEYPYYCAANVHFDGVDNSNLKTMWFTPQEIDQYSVCKGDLLVVEGGAGAGGCAIVKEIQQITGIQNSIQIVRPKYDADSRFLCYMIQALVKQKYIDVVCNKATIPHFTKDKLGNMPYLIWSRDEQREIADYLDEKCNLNP